MLIFLLSACLSIKLFQLHGVADTSRGALQAPVTCDFGGHTITTVKMGVTSLGHQSPRTVGLPDLKSPLGVLVHMHH